MNWPEKKAGSGSGNEMVFLRYPFQKIGIQVIIIPVIMKGLVACFIPFPENNNVKEHIIK